MSGHWGAKVGSSKLEQHTRPIVPDRSRRRVDANVNSIGFDHLIQLVAAFALPVGVLSLPF